MEKKRLFVMVGSFCLMLALITLTFVLINPEQAAAQAQKRAPVILRIAVGPEQIAGHMVSLALKKFEKYSDFLKFDLMITKSWLDNQKLMADHVCQIGWASGFQMAYQVEGIKDFEGKPYKDLRVLWATIMVPYHVVVLDKSPIKKLEDLEGKTTVMYSPGSLAHNMSQILDEATGIKRKYRYSASTGDMSTGLTDGTYDAITVGIGFGNPSFVDLFTSEKCRLIPISENIMQKFEKNYPGYFVRSTFTPGVYPRVDKEVPTFGVAGFFLADKSVPDYAVYELCKIWWGHTDEAIAIHKRACGDASNKAFVPLTGPVPRHPGALKYFKETGMLK
jgi:TRAP transporter TAXI family solute receptor